MEAGVSGAWGHEFEQEGAGGEGGSSICAWELKSSKGINLTVLQRMHQFIYSEPMNQLMNSK